MRTIVLIIIILFVNIFNIKAQSNAWRNARHSVVLSSGGSIFMGDLGGGDELGGHFLSFKDMDNSALKLALSGSYKYRLADRLNSFFSVTYTKASADDANAGNLGRRSRNLNFKSRLLEGVVGMEYYFIREKEIPRYAEEGNFWKKWSAYMSVGIGFLKFKPLGEYQGQWYELQPLHTEGQGTGVKFKNENGYVVTANEPYKLIAAAVPVGIGFKYQITRDMGVGLYFVQHFTSTDYIDDCSSYYFNYEEMGVATPSELTTIFADKSANGNTVTGKKRGNPNYNDTFFTAMITLHYKFTK